MFLLGSTSSLYVMSKSILKNENSDYHGGLTHNQVNEKKEFVVAVFDLDIKIFIVYFTSFTNSDPIYSCCRAYIILLKSNKVPTIFFLNILTLQMFLCSFDNIAPIIY